MFALAISQTRQSRRSVTTPGGWSIDFRTLQHAILLVFWAGAQRAPHDIHVFHGVGPSSWRCRRWETLMSALRRHAGSWAALTFELWRTRWGLSQATMTMLGWVRDVLHTGLLWRRNRRLQYGLHTRFFSSRSDMTSPLPLPLPLPRSWCQDILKPRR